LDRPPRPPSLPSHRRPTGRYPPSAATASAPARRVASDSTRLAANPASRSLHRTFPNRHCRSSASSKYRPSNRLTLAISSPGHSPVHPHHHDRALLPLAHRSAAALSAAIPSPPPPVEPPPRSATTQGEHGNRIS
jgi:hypothetical protein